MSNIKVRQSVVDDFPQLKELLKQLTSVGNCSKDNINNGIYDNIYVAYTSENIIVGCSTIIIEDKIIHEGGKVGHIEDVVVNNDYRGKGIGKLLINHCVGVGKKIGCYKIILDCDKDNNMFYEKCGFKPHGVCMRLDC